MNRCSHIQHRSMHYIVLGLLLRNLYELELCLHRQRGVGICLSFLYDSLQQKF